MGPSDVADAVLIIAAFIVCFGTFVALDANYWTSQGTSRFPLSQTQSPTSSPSHSVIESAPRVRREFRSLSAEEKNRFAQAVWTMKNLTTEEGVDIFGPDFVSYDELVYQHMCTFFNPKCHQGHFGPVLGTFHRAFLLRFENSLLAIDDRIGALPYWQMSLDFPGGKYYEDPDNYIFSGDNFGNPNGNASENNVVTDGLFARFPVATFDANRFGSNSTMASRSECVRSQHVQWLTCVNGVPLEVAQGGGGGGGTEKDTVVYLRDAASCEPFVVRKMGGVGVDEFFFTDEDFEPCTNPENIRNIVEWDKCVEFDWVNLTSSPGILGDFRGAGLYMDYNNSAEQLKAVYFPWNETNEQEGVRWKDPHVVNALHGLVHEMLGGDFTNFSSPNDPIFWVYHANMDRSLSHWMMAIRNAEDNDWGFPNGKFAYKDVFPPEWTYLGPNSTKHIMDCSNKQEFWDFDPMNRLWAKGTLANDPVVDSFPFNDLFQCHGGDSCKEITHRQILFYTSPERTPYTYDTLQHHYKSD